MTTVTGGLGSLRASNREQVLSLLRTAGALHRAELARRVGVSRSTVSSIVAELIAEGLVVEGAEPVGPGRATAAASGRPGELLSLNPSAGLVIGVDVSFAEVRVIAADLSHTVLAERVVRTPHGHGPEEVLALAADAVHAVVDASGIAWSRVLGVGLGVPGPVDARTGVVAASSNSLDWVGIGAAEMFAEELQQPVYADNTSHLASLGEVTWGAATGCRDVVYLKLSTGIGAGLTFDGRIYRGSVGAAGEIGHLTVDETGPACRCGNRGCLEVYAGAAAICRALEPVFRHPVSLADVLAAVAAGDRPACRVVSDAGRAVGVALASVCNLLNPELVVIGGDLAAAGEVLLEPLRAAVSRQSLAITSGSVTIVPGALGPQAGALGAVALVLQQQPELAP
ncbi:MAG: ROK family protein [Motilibacteraceae bacterium]